MSFPSRLGEWWILSLARFPHFLILAIQSREWLSLYIGGIGAINDLLKTAEYTYWHEECSAPRIKAALPDMIFKLVYTLAKTKKSPDRPIFMLSYLACYRAISTIYAMFSIDTKLLVSPLFLCIGAGQLECLQLPHF